MDPDWDIAAPRADALVESLRAFGYSPEAAIADLVDNSVSAGAKTVSVQFVWNGPDSVVTVTDDGTGMSETELVAAMRPGSISPLEERGANDLGRFGLGLKTASFSQARELTVISRTAGGGDAVRRWDLDTVANTGEWRLLRSGPSGTAPSLGSQPSGTVVQWSKLDRLAGSAEAFDQKAHKRFMQSVERVHQHLEATFYRFLMGPGRIRIQVNGKEARSWDPFLRSHPATQALPIEELPFRDTLIKVAPFVLPHRSHLSSEDSSRGAGAHGWNQQQGFYLYRSGRLLVQGDWLGLGLSKDEHTKLARVAVDFPASLDHDWQVDVKKSTARPPGELVENLRRVARMTRTRAEEVYRHRGKATARKASQPFVFAWTQMTGRDGAHKYRVNREHPVIAALFAEARDHKPLVERALRFAEETVPTSLIGISLASSVDAPQSRPFGESEREVRPILDMVFSSLLRAGSVPADALDRIAAAEVFSDYPQIVAAFREEKL